MSYRLFSTFVYLLLRMSYFGTTCCLKIATIPQHLLCDLTLLSLGDVQKARATLDQVLKYLNLVFSSSLFPKLGNISLTLHLL